MEEWKVIEGFKRHKISSYGNVEGVKGMMKSRINDRGYNMIGIRDHEGRQKMFLIHRLVAIHFINNPDNKKYVNHKDGNKQNNNVSNLEWCTQSENQIHAYKTGLQVFTEEQRQRLKNEAIKKRKPIRVINKKLGIDDVYKSIAEAAENVDCNEKTLRNVLKKRNKSRLGYEVTYI